MFDLTKLFSGKKPKQVEKSIETIQKGGAWLGREIHRHSMGLVSVTTDDTHIIGHLMPTPFKDKTCVGVLVYWNALLSQILTFELL